MTSPNSATRTKQKKSQNKEREREKRYKHTEIVEYSFKYSRPKSKKSDHGIAIDPSDPLQLTLPGFNCTKEWSWSDGAKITSTIFNIVMTADLGCDLNLEGLAVDLRKHGAQYNKKEFAAIVIRSGTISILLFSQGKIVCTGAKNVEEALGLLNQLVTDLKGFGYYAITLNDVRIQNIVVCMKLPWVIDLEGFHSRYSQICTYAPDVFPGCIIKYFEKFGTATSLVFRSGFVVIAGLKKVEELENLMTSIPVLIKEFKITSNSSMLIEIDDGQSTLLVPTHAKIVKSSKERKQATFFSPDALSSDPSNSKYDTEKFLQKQDSDRDFKKINDLFNEPTNLISATGDNRLKIPNLATDLSLTKKLPVTREIGETVDMPDFF